MVREYFNKQFSFYATGLTDEKMRGQLRGFQANLNEYGDKDKSIPKDWFDAFTRLRKLLEGDKVYREPVNNKRVIFLDELPWMDTAKSDFKSALDYFWNSWASAQEDLVLIACGSATSWIITNLLTDKKGFHNRVTRRLSLARILMNCVLRNMDIFITNIIIFFIRYMINRRNIWQYLKPWQGIKMA